MAAPVPIICDIYCDSLLQNQKQRVWFGLLWLFFLLVAILGIIRCKHILILSFFFFFFKKHLGFGACCCYCFKYRFHRISAKFFYRKAVTFRKKERGHPLAACQVARRWPGPDGSPGLPDSGLREGRDRPRRARLTPPSRRTGQGQTAAPPRGCSGQNTHLAGPPPGCRHSRAQHKTPGEAGSLRRQAVPRRRGPTGGLHGNLPQGPGARRQ